MRGDITRHCGLPIHRTWKCAWHVTWPRAILRCARAASSAPRTCAINRGGAATFAATAATTPGRARECSHTASNAHTVEWQRACYAGTRTSGRCAQAVFAPIICARTAAIPHTTAPTAARQTCVRSAGRTAITARPMCASGVPTNTAAIAGSNVRFATRVCRAATRGTVSGGTIAMCHCAATARRFVATGGNRCALIVSGDANYAQRMCASIVDRITCPKCTQTTGTQTKHRPSVHTRSAQSALTQTCARPASAAARRSRGKSPAAASPRATRRPAC